MKFFHLSQDNGIVYFIMKPYARISEALKNNKNIYQLIKGCLEFHY